MTPEDIINIVKAFFNAIIKVLKALGLVAKDVTLFPEEEG